jgi:putative transposase
MVTCMIEIFKIIAHLLSTLVRAAGPGGVRAVIAESLLLKHQLLVLSRSRNRAPRLTPWDRLVFGIGAFLVARNRLAKIAIGIKPATLLRFHRALVQRKYRLLFTPRARGRPGPKGPSKELIAAILEMKRRNPRFGCPRIAQQMAHAFGVEIDKDVVRRILDTLLGLRTCPLESETR